MKAKAVLNTLVVAGFVAVGLGFAANAQQINKRKWPGPGEQAKINRVLPQSRVQSGDGITSSSGITRQGCGDIGIGNVTTKRGQRGPREVITVVRGDVVKICR